MSETAMHTAGPWKTGAVRTDHHGEMSIVIYRERQQGLPHVIGRAVVDGPTTLADLQANANVMAGAPELLAALREVVGAHAVAANCFYCEANAGAEHDADCTMHFVLEAIRKAEGQS